VGYRGQHTDWTGVVAAVLALAAAGLLVLLLARLRSARRSPDAHQPGDQPTTDHPDWWHKDGSYDREATTMA
jgi:hypothetical protein